MAGLKDIWVYLSASPLLHLTLTLAAFQLGNWCYMRSRMNSLLNPVLLAIILIVSLLVFTATSYQEYFDGAQFVHFLLGPATVALAVPLYRQVGCLDLAKQIVCHSASFAQSRLQVFTHIDSYFWPTLEWWHGGVERPERSEPESLSAVATHGFHEKAVKPKLKFTSTRIQ